MAKNAVTDWSATPANNTDIAGTSIAVGCPPSDVGIFMRTNMAQIAAWIADPAGPLLKSGGTIAGNLAVTGTFGVTGNATFAGSLTVTGNTHVSYGSTVTDGASTDRLIGYRNLPFTAATSGRTLALTDVGMAIPATGAINIPTNAASAFAIGDIVAVYNNSGSSISITASGGVTLRLGGSATTGTRTLAQRGLVTLLKVATDEWVALNGGIS